MCIAGSRPSCPILQGSDRDLRFRHSGRLIVKGLPQIVSAKGQRKSLSKVVVQAFLSEIPHHVEKSQETARSIYLKALPGPLKWAPSYLVPLAAIFGSFLSVRAHHLLDYVQQLDGTGWMPGFRELRHQYELHTDFANIAVDTFGASLGALLIFVGLPTLDLILGQDPGDGTTDTDAKVFRTMLHSHVILYWVAVGIAVWACGNSAMHPLAILSLSASVGLAGDMSIINCHELLHSPRRVDHWWASAGLLPLWYMHWVPSHLAHHKKVGLFEDPTTARLGETFYRYLPRTILGNVRDGIDAELARLRTRGLSTWSFQNRILQWVGGPVSLVMASHMLCGAKASALLVLQAIFGVVMLESVNYVEHYGLKRKHLRNGQAERIGIQHSWQADWLFTNSIMLSVQRHSDHHAQAHRPYQELQNLSDAPQLPASYPVMMILAFFPGLFMDIMNPRALAAAAKEENQ